jgi:AcrR family transcriptional regulator
LIQGDAVDARDVLYRVKRFGRTPDAKHFSPNKNNHRRWMNPQQFADRYFRIENHYASIYFKQWCLSLRWRKQQNFIDKLTKSFYVNLYSLNFLVMAKKRLKTVIRHEQIAEAALDIVRSEGIRGLNIAAVAEKVGLVPSAVYRHFKNKSEIVGTVLELIQTRLNQHYQDVIQQNLEPVEKLNLLLSRHVEMIGSNNAIPRIIFSEEVIGGMPEKQQKLYDIIRDVIRNVAVIVTEGQNRGTIRRDLPAENIAVSFLGMIQPAAIIWNLSDGEFDLIQHSKNAWELFLEAIRHRPG